MIIGILDVETTGIEPESKVVEVSMVTASVEQDGVFLLEAVSVLLPCEENPAEHINGISPELSKRGAIQDLALLLPALSCDAFVAHNAKFDKSFVLKLPAFSRSDVSSKPWLCTLEDFQFDKPGRKLNHLAADFGVFFSGAKHRALVDCLLLLEVLRLAGPEKIFEALKRSSLPEWYLVGRLPISQNDRLKKAGFRWDPTKRHWHKTVRAETEQAAVAEFDFPVSISPTDLRPVVREKSAGVQASTFDPHQEALEELAREKAMCGTGI